MYKFISHLPSASHKQLSRFFLKIGIILLFFTGCEQKEDTEIFLLENKTQADVKRIKQQFEAINLPDAFLKEAFKVKWNQYEVIDNADGSLTYEFSTNLRSKYDLVGNSPVKSKNTTKIFSVYKLLAKESQDDVLDFEILKFTGNNSEELKDIRLSVLSDFNGAINYSTPEGTFVKDEVYNFGSLVKTIYQKPDPSLVAKAPAVDGTVYIYVITERVKDMYDLWFNGETGSFIALNWAGVKQMSPVGNWVPVDTGLVEGQSYHEHYDDPAFITIHGAGSILEDQDNHLEEIIIDPSFVNTKAECIYKKLNELSTKFKDAIKKFDGSFPVAHLELSVVNNIPTNNSNEIIAAQTLLPENYIIEIQFNQQYLNQSFSDITFARTFAHEILHAEIYRKLLSLTQTPNYQLTTTTVEQMRNNFPGLFDYYTRYFYNEWAQANYNGAIDAKTREYFTQIGNDWQHELIAAHYVNTMAKTLYEFANGAYTIEQCELFALGSLKGTVAWESVKNKPNVENLITNILTNGTKNCN